MDKPKILLSCLLVIWFYFFSAQNRRADSMRSILLSGATDTNVINTLLWVADEVRNSDADSALRLASLALDLSRKNKMDYKAARALNTIGNVHRLNGNYKEALKTYFLCQDIMTLLGTEKDLAAMFNNIGNVHLAMDNLEKGLEFHLKSLKLCEKLNDETGIARSCTNIGSVYFRLKNYSGAEKFHRRNLEIALRSNEKTSLAIGYSNLAEVKFVKGELDTSLMLYRLCRKISTELGNKVGLFFAFYGEGNVFREQDKGDDAILALKNAAAVAAEIDYKEGRMDACGIISSVYEENGNYQEALAYHKEFTAIKDSLFNEEKSRQTADMEAKYESAEKDKALLKKDAENRHYMLQRNAFLCGIILMAALVFLVFRSYRLKRKANLAISHQKMVIEEKQKEILDSIYYARRIQRALITSEKYIDRQLTKHNNPANSPPSTQNPITPS